MIFDAEKKTVGVAAVIRDDTARFSDERNLRKRILELEGANK